MLFSNNYFHCRAVEHFSLLAGKNETLFIDGAITAIGRGSENNTTGRLARVLGVNGKLVGNQKTDQYATIIWKDVNLSDGKNEVVVKTAQGDDSAVWNVLKK